MYSNKLHGYSRILPVYWKQVKPTQLAVLSSSDDVQRYSATLLENPVRYNLSPQPHGRDGYEKVCATCLYFIVKEIYWHIAAKVVDELWDTAT